MNLLYNVTVYTMDRNFSKATAIAWENDRIIATGDAHSLAEKYRDAKQINGNGATVLPGFIDPHIHFFDGAMFQGAIDCSPEQVPDIPSLKLRLSSLSNNTPAGQWIVAQGYDPLALAEKRAPDRFDLDAACPHHPVVVFHYSMHECVVNTTALDLLGIDEKTPQPHAGEIVKGRNGNLTGRLVETAEGQVISCVRESLIHVTETDLLNRIALAQETLFSYGITRIGDPAVSSSSRNFYKRAFESSVLKIPTILYPCDDDIMFALPFHKAARPAEDSDNDSLMNGPLKLFLDGADRAAVRVSLIQGIISMLLSVIRSVQQRSFEPLRLMLRSPFVLKKLNLHFGLMMASHYDCKRCAASAIENGYSLAFHAIGNEAVEQAAHIISSVTPRHPSSPPPRIEHALFLTKRSIAMIKKNCMAVVTQPAFLPHMGKKNVPPLPGFRRLPLRSLLDAGILVSGSSDWPVASCNPVDAIKAAVTRMIEKGEVVDQSEAVTLKEAVEMYTRNAAAVLGQLHDTGSLESGKRADFIVLSQDLFNTDPNRISDIQVIRTYLGGSIVYPEKPIDTAIVRTQEMPVTNANINTG